MRPRIYATGNETLKGEFNISYYVLQKDKSFLDWLGKLLIEVLEVQNDDQRAKLIINRKDSEEGDHLEDEILVKDIDKMIDLHEKYENKGERVDVFYGNDRVYVTLRKSREIRKKFADFVKRTREWIVVKEVKEKPAYVRKQEKIEANSYHKSL